MRGCRDARSEGIEGLVVIEPISGEPPGTQQVGHRIDRVRQVADKKPFVQASFRWPSMEEVETERDDRTEHPDEPRQASAREAGEKRNGHPGSPDGRFYRTARPRLPGDAYAAGHRLLSGATGQ